MHKKNILFIRIVATLCAIALPLHTIAGERPQNPQSPQPRPTFTRRRTSTGPQRSKIRAAQKKEALPQPAAIAPQQPIIPPAQSEEPMFPDETDEEMIPAEEQPTITAGEKNTETASTEPQSKIMNFVYAALIPVILLSLSKSFETGLNAVTKKTIKNFMDRDKFLRLNELAEEYAEKTINQNLLLGETIQPNDPDYAEFIEFKNTPREELINTAKEIFFKKRKMNFEQTAEETSWPNILTQAATVGMINTAVPLITGLVGLGFTLAIKYLMPKK